MEAIETGSPSHTMWNPKQGGYRAAMFVFAMVSLENIGFIANMASLVLYFMGVMHFDLSGSATTLTNFMGATFLLTIIGGFISDTYMTRLNTVLIFGVFELFGYILLTVQAHYKKLRPDIECTTCLLKGGNAHMFYITLCLLALGFGGIRGSLPALGGDQFDNSTPRGRKQLASFFNWLLLSITLGASLGVTIVVWVNMNHGWSLGFFISMITAIVGFLFLTVGKPFYRVRTPGESPLLRLIQVIVVAIRNRKLPIPESTSELYEINEKEYGLDQEKIPHTDQFRWLDRAAVLPNGNKAATIPTPGEVCSVTQVEELKVLIRMLPMLASTIMMNACLAQLQTFSVQQGAIMDLFLGPKFQVPAPSIPVIPLVAMSLLVPVYEFAFIPLARRITSHPSGITQLQRVAVGLILSAFSMAAAALVEVKRKRAFNLRGEKISLFWLSYQYGIFGVADMFTLVGLMEFFYSEAPPRMRSLSTSLAWLSLSFGYFLSSAFVRIVNAVTASASHSGKGWLYGLDLNQNRLELFYWLLAGLSCINFVVYLFCANWYEYRREATTDGHDEGEAMKKIEGEGMEKGEEAMEKGEDNEGAAAAATSKGVVEDSANNETAAGDKEDVEGGPKDLEAIGGQTTEGD